MGRIGSEMITVYFSISSSKNSFEFISENEIEVNIAWLAKKENRPFSRAARFLIDEILKIASSKGVPVTFNRSYERISKKIDEDVNKFAVLNSADLSAALAEIVVACRNYNFVDYDLPRQIKFSAIDSAHRVRFGAVEMRVVEAYLTSRDELYHRFEKIWRTKDLASAMLRPSTASSIF